MLLSEGGRWLNIETLEDTGSYKTVYNFRVADFRTYFVGCDEWGFDVWSHNACYVLGETMTRVDELAEKAATKYADVRVANPRLIPWPVARNKQWLWDKLRKGEEFLNVGLDPARVASRSTNYAAEAEILARYVASGRYVKTYVGVYMIGGVRTPVYWYTPAP